MGSINENTQKGKTETLRLFLQICCVATTVAVAFGKHPLSRRVPMWWTVVEGGCRNQKSFPDLITSRAANPLIIRNKKNRPKAKHFFGLFLIYPWYTGASIKFTRDLTFAADSWWKMVVCGQASDSKTPWKKHKANSSMKWQQEFIAGGSCQIGVKSDLNLTSVVNPYLEKVLFKLVLSCSTYHHHT